MYKKLFWSLFLIQSLAAQMEEDKDIYLYIDNFDASGSTVTFDIMMDIDDIVDFASYTVGIEKLKNYDIEIE